MAWDCHMETQPYGLVAIWQIAKPSSATSMLTLVAHPVGVYEGTTQTGGPRVQSCLTGRSYT